MVTSMKIRVSQLFKIYFLRLNMCLHIRTKFHISSIILVTFRRRGRGMQGGEGGKESGESGESEGGSFNHPNLKMNP